MDSTVSVSLELLMRLMTDDKNINAFHTSVINHRQLDCISFRRRYEQCRQLTILNFRCSHIPQPGVVSGPSCAW
ncbi:hypothetical protein T03_17665 [Trichinella britovi]|uniref:Uncharacterized protein n=1 Tax=Trichinella britovi TaxID=45882 RepID=A0A0V1ART7_TRIBR|nr:hypothetical protein T03_17665 [Trichinella britovi]